VASTFFRSQLNVGTKSQSCGTIGHSPKASDNCKDNNFSELEDKEGYTSEAEVKWKAYPHSQNSWLTPDKFDDDKIIQLYWAAKAPKRATAKSQSSKRT